MWGFLGLTEEGSVPHRETDAQRAASSSVSSINAVYYRKKHAQCALYSMASREFSDLIFQLVDVDSNATGTRVDCFPSIAFLLLLRQQVRGLHDQVRCKHGHFSTTALSSQGRYRGVYLVERGSKVS